MPTSALAHKVAARFNLKRQIALDSKTNASQGLNSLNEDVAIREEFATVDAICVNTVANFPFGIDNLATSKTDNFSLPEDFDATSGEYFLVYYSSQEKSLEVFTSKIPDELLCMPESEIKYQKFLFNLALGVGGGKAIIDKTKFDSLPNRGDLLKINIVRGDHAYSSNIISVQASKNPRCPNLPNNPQNGDQPNSNQPSDVAANGTPLNYQGTQGGTYQQTIGSQTITKNSPKNTADVNKTKFAGGLILKGGQGNKRTRPLTSMVLHYSLTGGDYTGMLKAFDHAFTKDSAYGVGTHFSIDSKGNIVQHLEINRVTNNCGTGGWNSKSIGIDLVGIFNSKGAGEKGWSPNPPETYLALYELMEELTSKYGVRKKVLWPNSTPTNRNGWRMAIDAKEPDKPFAVAKNFDGIVAHSHIQKNRRDGHCGTYYLKLRYEGKDHLTAYKMMIAEAKKNEYVPKEDIQDLAKGLQLDHNNS